MNKRLLAIFSLIAFIPTVFIVLSANEIHASWEWQNPLPQGNILTAVWLADQNHIYAVGYGSTIIQSNDRGENWKIIDRVTPSNLRGIWGTGNNNIYAVGEKGTVLHYDGVKWEETQQVTQTNLNAIWGTGENNFFIVGDEGTILHYNGFNIEELQSPVTEDLRAIWGRGETDIYAVGGNRKVVGDDMEGTGGIIIHFDGNGWSKVEHGLLNVPNLNGIGGKDNGHLYMVGGDRRNNAMTGLWHGMGGIVLHFDGITWDRWSANSDWNFYSIWGDGSTVYTVGAYIEAFSSDAPITYGKLFRLNGDVWEEVVVEEGEINGLLAIDGYNDTLFSVGLYGTILRNDQNNWQEISYGTRWPRFFMLGGIYPDQLFAVGGTWDSRAGMILHHNTSAGKWEEVYREDSSYFLGVWGARPDDIYAVGEFPLHYNGSTWEKFTTCTQSSHFWIWGPTPDEIYTWGDPCHFNGVDWEPFCPELTGGQFHGEVWGTSTNDIYAAGDKGLVLHYDGANCQDMGSGFNEILRGIWGSSSQDIYAVGGNGLTGFSGILHYDSQAWKELNIPHIMQHLDSLAIYFGVWGTGPDNVFITGYNGVDFDKASRPSKFRGTILHYNGDRWEDMSSGMGSFNNFVWGLSDGSHVYTGGMAGAILMYTPPIRKSIAGCVMDASDTPISNATVSLFAMGNAYWYTIESQSTENNGCFQIDELEPGRYYIIVEKEGFLPARHPSYGSFVLQEGEDLNIGSLHLIEGTISTSTTTTTTVASTSTTTTVNSRNVRRLKELYNSGEVEGSAFASSHKDFDGDGVNDVLCMSHVMEGIEKFVATFQAIKGKAFTPFYDWVTPYGDFAHMFGEIIDIDQNGTYELVYVSINQGSLENQLLARITVYDLLSRDPLWQSLPFYITSSSGPLPYFTFFGFLYDLTGTDDLEWVFFVNETDPLTAEIRGKVMVYKKNQNDVGFSQLLWEETYPGFSVRAIHDYDLDSDGKENLSVHLTPDQGSSNKGAIIHYRPSGDNSFSELVRFEASQPGNTIYTASYSVELLPTQVDHGIAGRNLIFRESWQEMDQKKYALYAYRADPPFAQIGTYSYDTYDTTGSLSFYLDDYDGDGWNEMTMHHSGVTSKSSNIEVYRVEGGNFTLTKIWETGDTSGSYDVYSHWDINQDSKADLCLAWIPSDSDTTSYGTLTFYEWTGDGFSQLYQFRAHYPGNRAAIKPLMDDDGMVTGPTDKLYVPVNLDCSPGNDLALHNYHLEYSPQLFSEGKLTIYNLPSQKTSMESEIYNAPLLGSIAHLQSEQSNDILMSVSQYKDGGVSSNVLVLGCNRICPLQKIYGHNAKEVAILRNFRDEVLSRTQEGRELIKLYYQWSPVIVKAIEKDGGIKVSLKEMINETLQLIQ